MKHIKDLQYHGNFKSVMLYKIHVIHHFDTFQSTLILIKGPKLQFSHMFSDHNDDGSGWIIPRIT